MDERVYTIPLRKAIRSPRNYRARKAMNLIEGFLERHLKSNRKNIKIGESVNEALWSRGMKKPPSRIKVEVYKDGDVFRVEMFGHKKEVKPKETKKVESKETEVKEEKQEEKKAAEEKVDQEKTSQENKEQEQSKDVEKEEKLEEANNEKTDEKD